MADPFLDNLVADFNKRHGTNIGAESTVNIDERPEKDDEQQPKTGFIPGSMVEEPTVIELGQEAGTRAAEVVEEIFTPPDMETGDLDALAFDDRVTLVNMEARKKGTNFRNHMQKWVALNRDPQGFAQMVMSMDDESASELEADMDRILQEGLDVFRRANPELPHDAVGIDEHGIPYIKLTHDGAREYISLDLWTQLRDEKFKIGGSIVGAGSGMVSAMQSPKGRALRGAVTMLSGLFPQGRYARQIGGFLNSVGKPFVYSSAYGAVGAGAGQGADDFYNSLYTGTRLKTGLAFRRAAKAAIADLSDSAVFGPLSHVATGVAYVGTKVVWNKFLGRVITSPVGELIALKFPTGPKMFDDALVRGAMKQLGLDPDDVVVQQQVRQATKDFLNKGVKDKRVGSALGLQAGAEAAEFTQPQGLGKALSTGPVKTADETGKQSAARVQHQEKVFNDFFGSSTQAKFNAQKRLAEIEKQYPGLKGMPDNVAREAGVLKAGLYGAKGLNDVSATLVNPNFWTGDVSNGLLFNGTFNRRVGDMSSGFQLSRWRLEVSDITGLFKLGGRKADEAKGTIPPAVALGLRGEVLGKPSEGLQSVAKGANTNEITRRNALSYLQGMSKIASDALGSPQAVSFNPIAYRQLESMVDTNYSAALQATRSFASDEVYPLVHAKGIDVNTFNRAAAEAKRVDSPSADFLTQLVEKVDPTKGYTTDELIDLSVWIRTWNRNNKFDGSKLPFGQELVNKTLVDVDKLIAKDLGKTAEGRAALKALNEFRELKKRSIELKSNRAFQEIERYTNKNVVGELTPENTEAINKIVEKHAISGDNKSMTMLLNKLPKAQARQLSDYLFDSSIARNTITTEDGYTMIDFSAVYRELSALGDTNVPYAKARMDFIKEFSDVLGGGAQIAKLSPGQQPEAKSLFRRAFETVGAGGLGTDLESRGKVAAVTGMVNLIRLSVFDRLGWGVTSKTKGIGKLKVAALAKATKEFFQNPLNPEVSARMKTQIKQLKAAAVKHEDIYSEIEAVEELLKRVSDAAYYTKAAATP